MNQQSVANSAARLAAVFLFGAVAGWCWEVLWTLFTTGVLVNRGSLHGPWLPIYGVGCLLATLLQDKLKGHPGKLFCGSVLLSGVLEYAASYAMERIYHRRWWDYSDCPLNLNGRVFLIGLLFFGVMSVVFAAVILPRIDARLKRPAGGRRKWLFALATGIFVLDLLLSAASPNVGVGISLPPV